MNSNIHPSSGRGIALIVVLLLMAVLSGLATGFAMTGNIELQMSRNEVYFAGARAAAEAGLNRAIVEIIADTHTNFLSGPDGEVNAANAGDAVNADNGSVTFLLGGAGPFALGTTEEYTYSIEVLDDDNDALYEVPLTPDQVTRMGEDGSIYTNLNDRLILRATGFGPNGTRVRIARVLDTVDTTTLGGTTTTLSNPAILVNGDFEMDGNITITGTLPANMKYGTVHANGNLTKSGAGGSISGDATASGTADVSVLLAGGQSGGGRPTINVPAVHAIDYIGIADYKLAVVVVGGAAVGQVQQKAGGVWTACSTNACRNTGWSYSGGTWRLGKSPASATYYVEGNVDIGPTSGSSVNAVSVIATGSINVHGNATLTPANTQKVQFVTDGDLDLEGNVDLDAPAIIDGQILVRGQFDAGGNMSFQGRVLVEDVADAGNLIGNGRNRVHGGVVFTYAGTLGAISTTVPGVAVTTYVNNISGWIEQLQ